MSLAEYEAANVTPPLLNSTAMKNQVNIQVTPTAASVDLGTLFGQIGTGHFFRLQADGAKVYIAFGPNATGSISSSAVGTGTTVCFPLSDGVPYDYKVISGWETATGVATMCVYKHLKFQGSATCTLRIHRSSAGPNQGSEAFPAP